MYRRFETHKTVVRCYWLFAVRTCENFEIISMSAQNSLIRCPKNIQRAERNENCVVSLYAVVIQPFGLFLSDHTLLGIRNSKLSVTGMHRSLAKQDDSLTVMRYLPGNRILLSRLH
jgi:hypothetical protein